MTAPAGYRKGGTKPIENMPGEIWKPIPGYEEKYEVSNMGRIKSFSMFGKLPTDGANALSKDSFPGRLLVTFPGRNDYLAVNISDYQGKQFSTTVHYLVLLTFEGPKPDGFVARHLNGDHRCNHASNLKWGTYQENSDDRTLHGNVPLGEAHPNAKLNDESVRMIRSSKKSNLILARELGMSYHAIKNAREGITWKHIV